MTKTSGGAGFSALAGGELPITDRVETVVTGSVRASSGVLSPFMEKRMGAFIDKAIMVLKVLIALLELIRIFF
ncbi:hypothetical protein O3L36_14405 [Yersinia pestis]|nr:hypothetical protein [Yersinia pestis]MDL0976497.1 hypothetical protein [Yersinia pestis]MDL0984345.1 hypothetical protein [Yersinia pestis]MDL1004114.1 hypothetical protein [Yersinia pestis]MDL1067256.1 hypothetical protein [Yersinia pestis]